MGDIRTSDLPIKTGCLEDDDRFYLIDSNGIGGFNSKSITFDDLVKAIHQKATCFGYRFLPCRLALNDIRQSVGQNIFTNTHGTPHPDATGATSLFQYSRTNIHLNNRLSVSKNTCVKEITCSGCDGNTTVAYATLGLYLNVSSDTVGPSGEELISAWYTKGANNDQSIDNYNQLIENENGTTPLSENDKLDLYGNNNELGNIGTSKIRKNTLDAGTEGTSTYYSFIIKIDPNNPQLTFDMMLTQSYSTAGGDKWSNHNDPSNLNVEALLYLEGFYA